MSPFFAKQYECLIMFRAFISPTAPPLLAMISFPRQRFSSAIFWTFRPSHTGRQHSCSTPWTLLSRCGDDSSQWHRRRRRPTTLSRAQLVSCGGVAWWRRCNLGKHRNEYCSALFRLEGFWITGSFLNGHEDHYIVLPTCGSPSASMTWPDDDDDGDLGRKMASQHNCVNGFVVNVKWSGFFFE